MKRILTSLCLGIFALALTAQGAQEKKAGPKAGPGKAVHAQRTAHVNVRAPAPRTQVNAAARVHAQRNFSAAPRTRTNAVAATNRTHVRNNNAHVRNVTANRNTAATTRVDKRTRAAVAREQNVATTRNQNVVTREQSIATTRNQTVVNPNVVNRNVNRRNVVVTNNWRQAQFSAPQYSAFQTYRRAYHDRGWYSNNYSNIVFVLGGWWYWNDPYWYPAWGYAPSSYYPYDGPIYGYNSLTPDRIVTEVQAQLQRDGYYAGAVDGVLGRQTRQALAAFQADHGLAITSAIDRPTLNTLGLS